MTEFKTPKSSPISSGWRGHISGHLQGTDSYVEVETVKLKLDVELAYALCNLLCDSHLEEANDCIDRSQKQKLSNLGAALGVLVGNPSANNGGRQVIK